MIESIATIRNMAGVNMACWRNNEAHS